jgi:hypothetical protein
MRVRLLIAIFALGCFDLVAILWLAASGRGEQIMPSILLGIFGLVIATLVLMGIFLAGKERWTAFILVATSLLLFSILSIFSAGIFIAPVGLFLLGFSLYKRLHRDTKRST